MQLGRMTRRTSYAFTHPGGRDVRAQDINRRLVWSARCGGTNAAVLKPERLSKVRHRTDLARRCEGCSADRGNRSRMVAPGRRPSQGNGMGALASAGAFYFSPARLRIASDRWR